MNSFMVGFLLLASPLQAQTSANCSIIDCPANFLPTPVLPSKTARQKVATALAAVISAEQQETVAAADLKKRSAEIRVALEKPYNRLPQWMIDRIVTLGKFQEVALSDPEYLLKQETLRTAIADNYTAHNAAILTAAMEFHLFPPIMDFTGDPRAASPNMAAKSWLPKYSRHETVDKNTGQWVKRSPQDLTDEARRDGAVAAALTHGDGSIGIFDNAFTTPEELAVLIFHETSHWVDVAGKSGGFKQSDLPEVSFRTEQRAYANAAIFAAQLGLNPQWHLDQAARFELQAKECEEKNLTWPQVILKQGWIGKDRKGLLAMAPAESEISAGDEELLRQKMAEAQATAAAQAQEQMGIAHREHDERLRVTYLDLAGRSCEDPGSVTQEELTSLPKPYDSDFVAEVPEGVDDCRRGVYRAINVGEDADYIERLSTPAPVPADVRSQDPHSPAAPAVPTNSFHAALPFLKQYAVAACGTTAQVPLDTELTHPLLPFEFYKEWDDRTADTLAAGLGVCEGKLFRRLIEVIRSGQGQVISAKWGQDTAASYRPAPGDSSGYTPPSGGGRGKRCEDYGNVRCP